MIACWTKGAETPVAREFFELFKTPWMAAADDPGEALRAPALLATSESFPPPGAPQLESRGRRLLVLASSHPLEWDRDLGAVLEEREREAELQPLEANRTLPVYCGAATFEVPSKALVLYRSRGRAAAFALQRGGEWRVRLGFNPLAEARFLLSYPGQPGRNASKPSLELHIDFLRRLMLWAGIEVTELAAAPPDRPYLACLTHDVDFWGLRRHKFDRTAAGFLYRALRTPLMSARGRVPWQRAARNLSAAARYPLVQMGLAEDIWKPLQSYREAEGQLRSTFFLIPRKGDPGQRKPQPPAQDSAGNQESGSGASRAVAYQAEDHGDEIRRVREAGWEMGLHGLDAWSRGSDARQEKAAIETAGGGPCRGVRMHWLYFEAESYRRLEEAGFDYDSTLGYNSAAGFRAGTAQAFRPAGARRILELPLTVQDTALFYPDRLGLGEEEAWALCADLLGKMKEMGGVFVLNWHGRSLLPERLWGDFYHRMLQRLSQDGCWMTTAAQAADWFRARRETSFKQDGPGCWRAEPAATAGNPQDYSPRNQPPQCLLIRTPRAAAGHPWQQTWDIRQRAVQGQALHEAEA